MMKTSDKSVHGLLFDLDNTLIDREGAFVRFASFFYEEHLRGATAMTREEAVARMVRWDRDGYADREGMFVRWVEEWPEVALATEWLLSWYRLEMPRHVKPDAGVNGLLANLNERRVPWGIVTNGNTTPQHGTCRAAGLDQIAPFIVVSEEAGYAKPDPRIFRDAFNLTGLASPEQVVFVGDNPRTDIDGAKRFGMKTAWVRRGRRFPDDLQPPDHVIDHVAELTISLFRQATWWMPRGMPGGMPRGDVVNVDAVDIRNNRVEFNVVDKAELHLKLDSSGVSLPLGVSVVEVDALSNPTADIFGGKTLTYKGPPRKECTSGFSVTDGTNEGVTTAGHCEDKQSYDGTSLNWESGTGQHPYDIQWFSTTAFTVRNLVYDGTNNRYIYDQELRADQYVGQNVCMYGITSAGDCGEILSTTFDLVNVETDISVAGGDSGGPFFWNNTAFGTTIYANGSNSIYGPVDQITGILGLDLIFE